MKLQIKTLARKQLVVDIEETKTVYDVKSELALYADVGVQPEYQKLIYNGKVLKNDDQLSTCDIDVQKSMVVMILIKPEVPPPPEPKTDESSTSSSLDESHTTSPDKSSSSEKMETSADTSANTSADNSANTSANTSADNSADTSSDTSGEDGDLEILPEQVEQFVEMGYTEDDVRQAIAASHGDIYVAVGYLLDGIPDNPPDAPASNNQQSNEVDSTVNDAEWTEDEEEEEDEEDDSPFSILRRHPLFPVLRENVLENPSLIGVVIAQLCGTNMELLELVNENREEFLSAMIDDMTDTSDKEDSDDDDD